MIGLQRYSVALCNSDETWRLSFEAERTRILSVAKNLVHEVLHVGSTSVPGLTAKPIIDLAVVVLSFDSIDELATRLGELGWIDRGYVRPDNYLFVLESASEVRTHHLHVVSDGSVQLREYLLFRDALMESSELRQRYVNLKTELASRFKNDRAAYTEAKSKFIESALEKRMRGSG